MMTVLVKKRSKENVEESLFIEKQMQEIKKIHREINSLAYDFLLEVSRSEYVKELLESNVVEKILEMRTGIASLRKTEKGIKEEENFTELYEEAFKWLEKLRSKIEKREEERTTIRQIHATIEVILNKMTNVLL